VSQAQKRQAQPSGVVRLFGLTAVGCWLVFGLALAAAFVGKRLLGDAALLLLLGALGLISSGLWFVVWIVVRLRGRRHARAAAEHH